MRVDDRGSSTVLSETLLLITFISIASVFTVAVASQTFSSTQPAFFSCKTVPNGVILTLSTGAVEIQDLKILVLNKPNMSRVDFIAYDGHNLHSSLNKIKAISSTTGTLFPGDYVILSSNSTPNWLIFVITPNRVQHCITYLPIASP